MDGSLGIDKEVAGKISYPASGETSGIKPVLGSAVDNARENKDAEEIELMRAASRLMTP